ncbi:CO2 hydration protein [Scytonema millei]|uniref:CO2 hydration protein n=1 Tax=Scytonema millei VB511283 TaxID=1245923 RepID=A0A9X5E4Y7_9CYAN|nr:CO2 hydration protein [Scytonema millei]NHC34264.1 CO2 hydration protein [Scytonema millei VB511283]
MVTTLRPSTQILSDRVQHLAAGAALLPDSPTNVMEVVGILESYGVVLDAYARNLIYVAENAFLEPFTVFKYFNGEVSLKKFLRYMRHDRLNFEYAEYCMKAMFWHGGGGLDTYLDSPEFIERSRSAIQAKFRGNWLLQSLYKIYPDFFFEQIRQLVYYSALGQFWQVMSEIFLTLSDRYNRQEITSIPQVVEHIQSGLVAAANQPITYSVTLRGQAYDILPASAGLKFLADTAVPYVEAIFLRGTPFPGTVSYNAQAHQIPTDPSCFEYGALYADPLPTGGAGIPPTLLMQDMRHFLPEYLHEFYCHSRRGEDNLHVQINQGFQKAMFCVTTAAIKGLAPHSLDTTNPEQQQANRLYLESWMNRLINSRLPQMGSW